MINSSQLSFLKFLFLLKIEMDLAKKDLVHSIRGDEVERNQRYEDNMRIIRLVGSSVTDILTFVSGIAYNL